mgnify:CR=1 FL=1
MMTMLMPTRRNFFNNLMADPFDAFFDTPFAPTTKSSSSLMRTDIKEHEGGFEMTIDLPGFKKEDVEAELKDGYLTVSAETKSETNEGDEKKGTWVRKERFTGSCSRTFYVGEDVKESAIKARFEHGTLIVDIPKPQPQPKIDEKKTIAIA